MDTILIFEEGRVFERDMESIKKACKKINEQLKYSNIITGDNIWELTTKELEYDPLKVNEKEFGGS